MFFSSAWSTQPWLSLQNPSTKANPTQSYPLKSSPEATAVTPTAVDIFAPVKYG